MEKYIIGVNVLIFRKLKGKYKIHFFHDFWQTPERVMT